MSSVASIAVIGSLNMDLVIRAPRRPHRGETLLGGTFGVTGGGKGSNQALAAARLGAEPWMVGQVGDDDFGQRLRDMLTAGGVDCAHLETRTDAGTGVAVITVTDDGESSIILSQGANALLDVGALSRAQEVFAASDAAIFQMEIPPATVAEGLKMAKRAGCRTFLSAEPPFPMPPESWGLVDYLVLNEMALAFYVPGHASSTPPSNEKVAEMARQLLSMGAGTVVVTQSSRGGMIFAPHGSSSFEPFKVHVVDNTGARDAFCAGLCVALAEGMSMERAARFASAAGALACTRIGAHTSMPWRKDVEALLEETAGDYAG